MKVSETTPVNSQTYMKRQQKIEGEGHGPLLPPSKDGHFLNQNLLQSVTPNGHGQEKGDKQGTLIHPDRIWVEPKQRAGCYGALRAPEAAA